MSFQLKRHVGDIGNRDKLLGQLVSMCGDLLSCVGRRQVEPRGGDYFVSDSIGRLLATIDALRPHLNVEGMEAARGKASSDYSATGEFYPIWTNVDD
jgi:hypothetical protein